MFKLWRVKVEVQRIWLHYLQTNSEEDFISTAFQNFYKKQGIKIGYIVLYMQNENNIAE